MRFLALLLTIGTTSAANFDQYKLVEQLDEQNLVEKINSSPGVL